VLTEQSYLIALYTYIAAALAFVLFLGWRASRYVGPGTVALLVLVAAALLLTPAYPKAGVTTFAPALIVAAFQWLTYGPDTVGHALRPLGLALAVAAVLATVLKLTLFRRPRRRAQQPPAAGANGRAAAGSGRPAPGRPVS